jgi:hypothetical protein
MRDMARGNDGVMTGTLPYPRAANQDRTRFDLGDSTARPRDGYFADVAGLSSEQEIVNAVAGLTDRQEIEKILVDKLGSQQMACQYMKWRMKALK